MLRARINGVVMDVEEGRETLRECARMAMEIRDDPEFAEHAAHVCGELGEEIDRHSPVFLGYSERLLELPEKKAAAELEMIEETMKNWREKIHSIREILIFFENTQLKTPHEFSRQPNTN